jgi:FkbM family methyltransferase
MRIVPKQIICGALRKLGYELQRTRPEGPALDVPLVDVFDLVVSDYLRRNPSPFLVQVGAHDGATDDPVAHLIRRHKLRGLLVEPQPVAFKRLVEQHRGDPQLAFENSLIGARDGEATFYKVREDMPGLPANLLQSASLDRERVETAVRWYRDENPQINGHAFALVEEITVPSLTWESLLAKHGVPKIDVLVIDAMGFDYELIKLLPFDRFKPDIIHFEHGLLSAEDQRACIELLVGQGYSLAKVAVDTIAVRNVNTRRWLFNGWAMQASIATAAEVLLEVLAPVPGLMSTLV